MEAAVQTGSRTNAGVCLKEPLTHWKVQQSHVVCEEESEVLVRR